ncbi:glutathione synthetase [Actinomycetaceae bacterium WB03_NA08]|uniref:Glutathione synthetase n=1 Tax=Scrofimicrobium canadense TaxID=2652290 RepID=A0A6N7W5D0_9ACTO|nr:glutathione synthetase [Scrofimicrobium canadense]MSS83713.1 glutathione synthetase [Scrofimicrobium canadense]
MTKPRVTLATAASMPNLYADETGLLDALADRGMDPHIAVWNDPAVDWDNAGLVVIRSVVDYAADRNGFLEWTRSLPRVLNHADVLEWNSDKHYLNELAERGLPTIPTTWLSASRGYSKHQVHSRFPAFGDFVVKPAVSSGVRDIGRYSSTSILGRQAAIAQVMELLGEGRDVMIQRYEETVETQGERSLIFFNGIISHAVDKGALLTPAQVTEDEVQQVPVEAHSATDQELRWGEQIRLVLHEYVRERMGRDEQFLFNRVDLVPDGKGSFVVMEVALVDADLYLNAAPRALGNFADAISVRAFW